MGEYEPLVIVPDFIHFFNKLVRIIALNDIFCFGSDINVNKLPDILSYLLIQVCLLVDSGFGSDRHVKLVN